MFQVSTRLPKAFSAWFLSLCFFFQVYVPEVLGIQVPFGNPRAFGTLEGKHLTQRVDVDGWGRGGCIACRDRLPQRQELGGLDGMWCLCPCEPYSPHTPTLLLVGSPSLQ